jgi:hypothetical protein
VGTRQADETSGHNVDGQRHVSGLQNASTLPEHGCVPQQEPRRQASGGAPTGIDVLEKIHTVAAHDGFGQAQISGLKSASLAFRELLAAHACVSELVDEGIAKELGVWTMGIASVICWRTNQRM